MSLFARLPGYAMTGGTAAVVDVGGFWLLSANGVATPVAATLSFLVAAVVNYQLSARLVFRHQTSARHFGRFLAAALVGLMVNVGVTTLAASAVPPVLAKVIGIGVAFFINYLLAALLVFRPAADKAPDRDAP